MYATDCVHPLWKWLKLMQKNMMLIFIFFLPIASSCSEIYDVIISNPPYISKTDLALWIPEFRIKSKTCSYGGEDGLDLSKITSAKLCLFTENGFGFGTLVIIKRKLSKYSQKRGLDKILIPARFDRKERYLFIFR